MGGESLEIIFLNDVALLGMTWPEKVVGRSGHAVKVPTEIHKVIKD